MEQRGVGISIHHKQKENSFALLGLLLTIALILFLFYLVLSAYLKQFPFSKKIQESLSDDERISEYLSKQGMASDADTATQRINLDRSRKTIDDLDKQLFDGTRQLREWNY